MYLNTFPDMESARGGDIACNGFDSIDPLGSIRLVILGKYV
jgi:hypothetical protein